mmetsp:Transcript_3835/g.6495  ORF Transcript_3835/g.6495 Transcript_3835/m.6495 type:complete len:448 (+) Transcript_3835:150-1493(+)
MFPPRQTTTSTSWHGGRSHQHDFLKESPQQAVKQEEDWVLRLRAHMKGLKKLQTSFEAWEQEFHEHESTSLSFSGYSRHTANGGAQLLPMTMPKSSLSNENLTRIDDKEGVVEAIADESKLDDRYTLVNDVDVGLVGASDSNMWETFDDPDPRQLYLSSQHPGEGDVSEICCTAEDTAPHSLTWWGLKSSSRLKVHLGQKYKKLRTSQMPVPSPTDPSSKESSLSFPTMNIQPVSSHHHNHRQQQNQQHYNHRHAQHSTTQHNHHQYHAVNHQHNSHHSKTHNGFHNSSRHATTAHNHTHNVVAPAGQKSKDTVVYDKRCNGNGYHRNSFPGNGHYDRDHNSHTDSHRRDRERSRSRDYVKYHHSDNSDRGLRNGYRRESYRQDPYWYSSKASDRVGGYNNKSIEQRGEYSSSDLSHRSRGRSRSRSRNRSDDRCSRGYHRSRSPRR